jgi:hypothetical protein
MNPDIGTMIGDLVLLGLLGLYLWWVIAENKRDWVNSPHRPTRHISLILTCIGAIAVILHVIGFNAGRTHLISDPLSFFVSGVRATASDTPILSSNGRLSHHQAGLCADPTV